LWLVAAVVGAVSAVDPSPRNDPRDRDPRASAAGGAPGPAWWSRAQPRNGMGGGGLGTLVGQGRLPWAAPQSRTLGWGRPLIGEVGPCIPQSQGGGPVAMPRAGAPSGRRQQGTAPGLWAAPGGQFQTWGQRLRALGQTRRGWARCFQKRTGRRMRSSRHHCRRGVGVGSSPPLLQGGKEVMGVGAEAGDKGSSPRAWGRPPSPLSGGTIRDAQGGRAGLMLGAQR
ncbi:unnamed protein product, partial [Discosporangium mesarthrocarpum]